MYNLVFLLHILGSKVFQYTQLVVLYYILRETVTNIYVEVSISSIDFISTLQFEKTKNSALYKAREARSPTGLLPDSPTPVGP